jgi:hypothetical protein
MTPSGDAYIYIWRRPNGEPFYVGAGVNNRFRSIQKRNPHTLAVLKKLGGIDSIQIEIIKADSWTQALALECEYIARFGRSDLGKGPLTNKTDGGEGTVGRVMSEEERAAISARQAGKPRPPEILAAMWAGQRCAYDEGRNPWTGSAANRQQLLNAIPAAREWHKSEEAKLVHVRIGKESWNNRRRSKCVCNNCGQEFMSLFPMRAKWCHVNCRSAAVRKKLRATHTSPPHHPKPLLALSESA